MPNLRHYLHKGKHRAPTTSRLKQALVVSAATAALGFTTAGTALAEPNWDAIVACESGGKNVKNARSTASGYFQIVNGTWAANGGREFAPTAMQATRAEQQIVANRIASRRGSLADWNASKGCWGGKAGSVTGAQVGGQAAARVDRPAVKKRNSPGTAAPVQGGYRVRVGDTLAEIAVEHNVRGGWQALHAKNDHVKNPNRIYVGQLLDL